MQKKISQQKSKTTSWGSVDTWYDDYVEDPESYHQKVVEPNLIRMVGEVKGKSLLDLACGQGYFSRLFSLKGAEVTGVDISPELIKKAKTHDSNINYIISSAEEIVKKIKNHQDIIISVLALQNMKDLDRVFSEVKSVLKEDGRFIFVLNHPAFRIPKDSDWSFNEDTKKQGRVVTKYLSDASIKIDMHPGSEEKTFTYSFHHPLQFFVKMLSKNSMAVTRLEEWISHKTSAEGPRKEAEDKARKEIPLFMCIEARILVQ